jgi:hypothetical protein
MLNKKRNLLAAALSYLPAMSQSNAPPYFNSSFTIQHSHFDFSSHPPVSSGILGQMWHVEC